MYILTTILGATFFFSGFFKRIAYRLAYGGLCIYSAIVHHFTSINTNIKKYIISCRGDDKLTNTIRIKDNEEVTDMNSPVDFLVVSTTNKESLQKWNKVYASLDEAIVPMKKCEFRFISCCIKFGDSDYILSLNDANETYFIVDNILNKLLLLYLLKKQHGLSRDSTFKVCFIDHNVRLFTIDDKQCIVLRESDYLIKNS
jgi:hypothetical protein